MRAPVSLEAIDLTDPDLYARGDPHAAWRLLRERAPVYLHPNPHGRDFWVLTRYEDVVALSADRRLSSAGGTSTVGADAGPVDGVEANILVVTDPPRHTRLRALVNKAFTPRVVAALEPYVRQVVIGILEEALDRGECDFVGDVAARLPFTVICELLGVPPDDRPDLFEAVGHFMDSLPDINYGASRMLKRLDVAEYFFTLAAERREVGGDDLMTRLVGAEVDGERLSDADVVALCVLLFVAGSETTMNATSGGMLAFVEHPDEQERLRAEPSLWPRAVEEILRWTSPVLVGMVRTAIDPIEVRGVTIRKGEKVTLWYPSANRDAEAFAEADRFDVGRDPNPHVTFGAGAHFCLGASLARLEIRVMFEEIARLTSRVELTAEPTGLRSNTFHGFERMPVRLGR